MKALILSAGLGTRLRPYTELTPKPLFSVNGRTLLDRIILQLHQAGCRAIRVNTHHLHDRIETYLAGRHYPIPVSTCYEPEILGTGGAIRNLAAFWDRAPFIVINCDILTDIDLRAVYDFHCRHKAPATLVLTDAPEFNTVSVDRNNTIIGFDMKYNSADDPRQLTFTGIQVVDPGILDLIPDKLFVHSIDVYRHLIDAGTPPMAYVATGNRWADIGTPERFREAAMAETAPFAFRKAFGESPSAPIKTHLLAGDGSDRTWCRLEAGGSALILADHGIRQHPSPTEIDAFIAIGTHLFRRGVRVPEIYGYDLFSGLAFLEDLGDTHLQDVILKTSDTRIQLSQYRCVIDQLVHMATAGKDGFDTAWTCQSARYDRNLILERECRYFVEAFLNGWLQLETRFDDLASEFHHLADGALSNAVEGFMHRDFQSRNIMVRNGECFLIDFQGGRLGPIQYDLASLLIDPYVRLPLPMQSSLLEYGIQKISAAAAIDPEPCRLGYRYCSITRNLQMLGAFGYLSRVKGKPDFAQYIPAAAASLDHNLSLLAHAPLEKLRQVANIIMQRINP
jgi:aminoglycoside/choline kinase family phosphotransferase/dTDP-glucose pyrophosphorylase